MPEQKDPRLLPTLAVSLLLLLWREFILFNEYNHRTLDPHYLRFLILLFPLASLLSTTCVLWLGNNRQTRLELASYLGLAPLAVFFYVSQFVGWKTGTFPLIVFIFLTLKLAILGTVIYHQLAGRRNTRRAIIALAVFYFTIASWHVSRGNTYGDEPHYLLITHSLIQDHDINQKNNYEQRDYLRFYRTKLIPKPSDRITEQGIYSQGLGFFFPFLLVPGYLLAGWIGVLLEINLWCALLVIEFFRFLTDRNTERQQAASWALIYGISLPFAVFTCQVYPDVLASLFFLAMFRRICIPSSSPRATRHWVILLLLPAAVLLKFRFSLIAVPLLLYAIFRRRRSLKWVLTISTAGLIFSLALFLLDTFNFGGDLFLTRFGNLQMLQQYLPGWRTLLSIPGLLIDQEAGLFFFAPVFVSLLVPRQQPLSRELRRQNIAIWLLITPYLLAIVSHRTWHSLPTPPLRYLIPVLPLLLATGNLSWKPARGSLGIILHQTAIAFSLIHTWLLMAVPEWRFNLADGTNVLLENIGTAFNYPLTSFFPSLIRITRTSVLWLLLAVLLLLVLRRRHRILPPVCAGLTAACLFVSVVAPHHLDLPRRVDCEDTECIDHSGGRPYPFPKDPYFHREVALGWTLDPGNKLVVQTKTKPGPIQLRVVARPSRAGDGGELIVECTGNALEVLHFPYTGGWQNHSMILNLEGGVITITLANPSPFQVLHVDRLMFYPHNPWLARIYSFIAHLTTRIIPEVAIPAFRKCIYSLVPGERGLNRRDSQIRERAIISLADALARSGRTHELYAWSVQFDRSDSAWLGEQESLLAERAWLDYWNGKYHQASIRFARLRGKHPLSARYSLGFGLAEIGRGRYEAGMFAIAHSRFLKEQPLPPFTLRDPGTLKPLFAPDAFPILESLFSEDAFIEAAELLVLEELDRARYAFCRQQTERALTHYRRGLQLDPFFTARHLPIRSSYFLYHILPYIPRDHVAISLALAQVFTADGDADRALSEYRILLKQNPNNPYALLGSARCLLSLGKPWEARSCLRKARHVPLHSSSWEELRVEIQKEVYTKARPEQAQPGMIQAVPTRK